MIGLKKSGMIVILGAFMLLLVGCSVGTQSLFVHPTEQGFPYEVTYDALGGHINQIKVRTSYYAEDSLIYKPSGTAGMLVEPKNGKKSLVGWYTKYTSEETANGTIYLFDENDLWDFDQDRLNASVAPEEKLTLYARWAENPTINFVDAENLETDSLLKWTVNVGSILSKPTSAEPTKAGYTLLDYYVDPECTTRYEFGEVVTEENMAYDEQGNAYITIYCKFIEGEFIRIKTVSQLKSIAENPTAYYILANDLDLSGETWTPIPSFQGELDGNGYSILNLTVNAKNRVAGIAAKKAEELSYGLFATLDGAKISRLTMKDSKIVIDSTSNVKLCAGVLAGRTTKSTITDCTFDGVTIEATGALNIDIVISPTVVGNQSTKLVNINLSNFKKPSIVTKGNLEELSGN